MPISPQKNREILFLLLYSDDFGGGEDVTDIVMAQLAVTKRIVREAYLQKEKIVEKKETLDLMITEHSTSYEFERIPRIERNVLRLGVYEIMYDSAIPPKVAIAEAIRLTRKFATPESATFVNAILDSILKSIHVSV